MSLPRHSLSLFRDLLKGNSARKRKQKRDTQEEEKCKEEVSMCLHCMPFTWKAIDLQAIPLTELLDFCHDSPFVSKVKSVKRDVSLSLTSCCLAWPPLHDMFLNNKGPSARNHIILREKTQESQSCCWFSRRHSRLGGHDSLSILVVWDSWEKRPSQELDSDCLISL